MKRQFVIEVDSDNPYVHVFEVTKEFSSTVDYRHDPSDMPVLTKKLGPKFYGQLDLLLVTEQKIDEAAPITPEPELTPIAFPAQAQEQSPSESVLQTGRLPVLAFDMALEDGPKSILVNESLG